MANRNNEGVLQNIDWILVSMYLLMVTMGWFNIYAAVYNEEYKSIFDTSQSYGMQLVWIISSLFIAFVILVVDGEAFPKFAWPIYGAFLLLLIAVIFVGAEVKGSKSWIGVGSFRVQPAEFAKFATNLAIAKYLSNINIKIDNLNKKLVAGALFAVPALIIILQNETGSALVYGSFILVLFREGLSGNFLIMGLMMVVLFVLALLVD